MKKIFIIPVQKQLRSVVWYYLAAVIFAQLLTISIVGQTSFQGMTPSGLAPGSPSGSYQLSDFESINVYNGNLNFGLPLTQIGGRGAAGYALSLGQLGFKFSYRKTIDQDGNYEYYLTSNWQFSPLSVKARYSGGVKYHCTPLPGQGSPYDFHGKTLTRLTFTTPDGTQIELIDTDSDGQPKLTPKNSAGCVNGQISRGTTFKSKDGSNLTFIANSVIYDQPRINLQGEDYIDGVLLFPSGIKYNFGGPGSFWIEDANGNYITRGPSSPGPGTLYTDSNNRQVISETVVDNTYGNCRRITFPGTNGAQRHVWMTQTPLANALKSGFTVTPIRSLFSVQLGPNQSGDFNPTVTNHVYLPDGRSYNFLYDNYGEVVRVELPTGGVIEYNWEAGLIDGPSDGSYQGTSTLDPVVYRRVVKRKVYSQSGTLESETRYSKSEYQNGSSIGYFDVDSFDNANHLLNKTRHYYYGSAFNSMSIGLLSGLAYTGWKEGKEYQTEFLDQSSVLLRRITMNWKQRAPISWYTGTPDGEPANDPRIVETTTELLDVNPKLVSKTTSIDPSNPTIIGFDDFNNQTDVWAYDWGQNAPGAFLKRTHTDYVTDPNYTSQTGAYLRRLPLRKWVSSDTAGNNKTAWSEFEYDNYGTADARHAGLLPRSNATGHDATYNEIYSRRGNVTQVTSYTNAANQTAPILVSSKYDVLGNIIETKDGLGYTTTINYDDNFGLPDNEARLNTQNTGLGSFQTFAFPTRVSNVLGYTAYKQFDYFTGAAVNAEDANGVIGRMFYNDVLDRPTQSATAVGTPLERQTSFAYYDGVTSSTVTATTDFAALNDNLLKTVSYYDGLGRVTETWRYEANGGYVATKSIPFLAMQDPPSTGVWRAATQTSNPYRPQASEQPVWTTTLTDELGRVSKIITPDGARVQTAYSGNQMLVTDQALKQRISETNALGQLKKVWEIKAVDADTVTVTFSGHPEVAAGYLTSYTYDTLSNLITVNQGGQTRGFTFDSLSRLKSVTNPELGTTSINGTINYTYDLNNNLQTKLDPRGVKTIYDYDLLNRNIKRCYTLPNAGASAISCAAVAAQDLDPNTPAVSYLYDNLTNAKGKLTEINNGISKTKYTLFDTLGRIRASEQTTDGVTYPFTYKYNLSGTLTEETYPSGRTIHNNFASDGALASVSSRSGASAPVRPYAASFTYTAAGAVSAMQLGNNRWETTLYNSRLQPTQFGLGTTNNSMTADLWKVSLDYGGVDNNGNVKQQTIVVPNVTVGGTTYNGFTAVQTYNYDSLNRLQSAYEMIGTQTWKQTFLYDRFGNRTFDTANGNTTIPSNCTTAICNPAISSSKNRFSDNQGYSYDQAGNLTQDALLRKFTYDGRNKQTKAQTVDNNGNVISDLGSYFYDGDGRRVKKNAYGTIITFVYDAGGKLAAEYANNVSTASAPQTSYLTNDYLGSPRLITDQAGNVKSRRDFLPFGEDLYTNQRITQLGYNADSIRQKFTGYEKDQESGLDYAKARMYSSNYGRFSSFDPLSASSTPTAPITWNRYVYALNNPLKITDHSGMKWTGIISPVGKAGAWSVHGWFDKAIYKNYSYSIDEEQEGDGKKKGASMPNATGPNGEVGKPEIAEWHPIPPHRSLWNRFKFFIGWGSVVDGNIMDTWAGRNNDRLEDHVERHAPKLGIRKDNKEEYLERAQQLRVRAEAEGADQQGIHSNFDSADNVIRVVDENTGEFGVFDADTGDTLTLQPITEMHPYVYWEKQRGKIIRRSISDDSYESVPPGMENEEFNFSDIDIDITLP